MNALLNPPRRAEEVTRQVANSWRNLGHCRGSDPDVFYPPSEDDAEAEAAKSICCACPVRQRCLEFALATREKHGVWGGLTERERRRVLRQRRRTA